MTGAHIESGNAAIDHTGTGWFVGHFVDPSSLRSTHDVEVKWAFHPKGDVRASWAHATPCPCINLLVKGRTVTSFPDAEAELSRPGDYVIWQDVPHSFRAVEDSVVLTIRWPSAAAPRHSEANVAPRVETGNAGEDNSRGWFIGHFIDASSVRSTGDVEVKWGDHPKGDIRKEWAPASDRPTLTILLKGRIVHRFPDKNVEMSKEGDYVTWTNATHTYESLEDTVTIAIRWPSVPKA